MEKKLPIYRMTINEEDEHSGVDFVALVDSPAIQMDWQYFNEHKVAARFKADADRHIISGALMVADLPIYRNDKKHGEYYVVFDAKTIESIALKFMKNGYLHNTNLMHNAGMTPEGVYMFESFIVDSTRGINSPDGYDLTNGSWFGSYKIENLELWDEFIKTGKFKGFSVEGLFSMVHMGDKKENDIIEDIEAILKS